MIIPIRNPAVLDFIEMMAFPEEWARRKMLEFLIKKTKENREQTAAISNWENEGGAL